MLTPPRPFLCCSVASICIFIALRLYYMRQNVIKRRKLRAAHRVANGQDALAEGEDNDSEEVVNEHRNAFNDLTDRQNGAFEPVLLLQTIDSYEATDISRLTL